MNISLTSTEQSSGELAKDNLANAIEAIRKDGYVIIEQVVDHAILDALKTRMDEDSAKLIGAQQWGGAGRVQGHFQPTLQKGDILIRDSRLWHRGVPNLSDHNRHMIAVVYNIGWLVRRRTLFFDKSSEEIFGASDVDPNAEFIAPPFEYLFEMACRKIKKDPMRGV